MRVIRSFTILGVLALAFLLLPLPTAQAGGHRSDEKDIVETAVAAGSFNTLVTAVEAAGLVDALKGEGPLTVFAPTDEAFAKLPEGTVESLLRPENRDQLRSILTYHVVAGQVGSADVTDGGSATTLQGDNLSFSVEDGVVMVGGATVTMADVGAGNGVIHVIDSVLLPE